MAFDFNEQFEISLSCTDAKFSNTIFLSKAAFLGESVGKNKDARCLHAQALL